MGGGYGYFVTNEKLHSFFFAIQRNSIEGDWLNPLPVNVFRTILKSTKYDSIFVVSYLKKI